MVCGCPNKFPAIFLEREKLLGEAQKTLELNISTIKKRNCIIHLSKTRGLYYIAKTRFSRNKNYHPLPYKKEQKAGQGAYGARPTMSATCRVLC